MSKKKEIKEKKHTHKWQKDYIDCPSCGGCEVRWCGKEGCHKNEVKIDTKWEEI